MFSQLLDNEFPGAVITKYQKPSGLKTIDTYC
jgi:hypothetical protein